MTDWGYLNTRRFRCWEGRTGVSAELPVRGSAAMATRRRALGALLIIAGAPLAGCSNSSNYFSSLPSLSSTPGGAPVPAATVGTGQVKVAVILPLSAPGNAGLAGQAMRNAAEMAFAEFNATNIQLLMKDDAGTPEGARAGCRAGAQRRSRDHCRAAVCPVGRRRRPDRALAQHSGDRVFDRYQCRHAVAFIC